MFRLLWAKKSMIVFLALVLVLIPSATTKPAQMLSNTVIVTLGIDKIGDEYEASGYVVVNEAGLANQEKRVLKSEKGNTVFEAIENIGRACGASVGLKHCSVLAIGGGLNGDNLLPIFERFITSGDMANNSFLTYTSGSAKDLLESEKDLQKICEYNNKYVYKRESSLRTFYIGYLSKNKTSYIDNAVFVDGKFVELQI